MEGRMPRGMAKDTSGTRDTWVLGRRQHSQGAHASLLHVHSGQAEGAPAARVTQRGSTACAAPTTSLLRRRAASQGRGGLGRLRGLQVAAAAVGTVPRRLLHHPTEGCSRGGQVASARALVHHFVGAACASP